MTNDDEKDRLMTEFLRFIAKMTCDERMKDALSRNINMTNDDEKDRLMTEFLRFIAKMTCDEGMKDTLSRNINMISADDKERLAVEFLRFIAEMMRDEGMKNVLLLCQIIAMIEVFLVRRMPLKWLTAFVLSIILALIAEYIVELIDKREAEEAESMKSD